MFHTFIHTLSQPPVSLRKWVQEWWDEVFIEQRLEYGHSNFSVACKEFVGTLFEWLCSKFP